MRLFTVGPVMMYPDILEGSGKQLPYFRTSQFSEIMLESESILKGLLGAGEGSRVAFLTASGTGAMEASVAGFFGRTDRLLIIRGGGFGKRFCEICDAHGIPHDDVELPFGKALTESDLARFAGTEYSGMLVNMDETSTGQLYDIKMLSAFCRRKGMYLIVDAISAFLADPIDMEKDGIDAIIISSQKALSLAPGISAVVMRRGIYEEKLLPRDSGLYYLDLKRHILDQERGQTPFTPAVGILLDLNAMLRKVAKEGLEAKIKRTADLAAYFRKGASEMGIPMPDYPLSNAVTPILFDGNAYDVFLKLRDEYDITLTPSGGDLRGKILRVGHIGNLSEEDYDVLFGALKEVLGKRGCLAPSSRLRNRCKRRKGSLRRLCGPPPAAGSCNRRTCVPACGPTPAGAVSRCLRTRALRASRNPLF
jgi:aspartate aminotransferase-like enzyme